MSDDNIFEEFKAVSMNIKSISVSEDELILEWKNGNKDSYKFKDLKKASIITTDRFPMEDEDVFWLMMFNIIIMIPQGVPGTDGLLKRMQKLPRFNNNELIKAMLCVENNAFLVWEKEKK
ncbi:MAG: hypothetical protein ACTSO9_09770 [Candidatus Helarchaeota archaeon]